MNNNHTDTLIDLLLTHKPYSNKLDHKTPTQKFLASIEWIYTWTCISLLIIIYAMIGCLAILQDKPLKDIIETVIFAFNVYFIIFIFIASVCILKIIYGMIKNHNKILKKEFFYNIEFIKKLSIIPENEIVQLKVWLEYKRDSSKRRISLFFSGNTSIITVLTSIATIDNFIDLKYIFLPLVHPSDKHMTYPQFMSLMGIGFLLGCAIGAIARSALNNKYNSFVQLLEMAISQKRFFSK